ncbi:MAG: SPFH domain-containing protein [bacterium]|nr:SPFH domain-containing protein [bacterium]
MKTVYYSIVAFVLLALVAVGGYAGFQWFYCRVYVEPGESLMVRYRGPLFFEVWATRDQAPKGAYAEKGQIGIWREMVGPGRHFFNPFYYETTIVKDELVLPGQVAIVRSKLGKDLPAGQFLVDGDLNSTDFKGIMRNAYTAGRYRINPYGYDFKTVELEETKSGAQTKVSGWVQIPTGYVGVVTNKADNPLTGGKKGVQNDVLPPGIYPINGREQAIDIVGIGLWDTSVSVEKVYDPKTGLVLIDESGEPLFEKNGSGIDFPSSDGFKIHMDFTAVWGIDPDQAPDVVRKFGNVNEVEQKVTIPQIESICRNHGSNYKAENLLVGEERKVFQENVQSAFQEVLQEKQLRFQYGLVRKIYIPLEVRVPKQAAFIADELTLTRQAEQMTEQQNAELAEATKRIELERDQVDADTKKLVAKAIAEGDKTYGETNASTKEMVELIRKEVDETDATTEKLVAVIDRETAELEAKASILLGEAEAETTKLKEEAEASLQELAVAAFGDRAAYNAYVFANELPDDIELDFIFAGEGTFWTDLKGFQNILLGKQQAEKSK